MCEKQCRGWEVGSDVRLVADVTDDGAPDIVAFGAGEVWTATGRGDGTFGPSLVALRPGDLEAANQGSPRAHVRLLAQLTPDHRPDLVIFGDAGVWTQRTGMREHARMVLSDFGVQQGWDPVRHPRVMANLDAGGLADIVGFGDGGVWTALGKGDGTFAPPRLVLAAFGARQGWSSSNHVRLLADLDGDGVDDIVAFEPAGNVWTALGKGDGTFAPPRLVLTALGHQRWDSAKHVRMTANLRTAGRADLVAFGDAGVWTALGRGDGSFEPPRLVVEDLGARQGWNNARHVRTVANVRGAAPPDLVGFGDHGVWVAPGNGDGTFAPPRLVLEDLDADRGWDSAKHVRTLIDLDRDGRADLVGFGDRGVWTALATAAGGFATPRLALDSFGCQGRFEFNLEWSELAPGGYPRNPAWRRQRTHPGVPDGSLCHYFSGREPVSRPTGTTLEQVPELADCTDQIDRRNVDQADGLNWTICNLGLGQGFAGHVNWFTTTYEGELSFGDHGFDDDYTLSLQTDGSPAVLGSRTDLHVEFDSDETIDHFETPWWRLFHCAVDYGDYTADQRKQVPARCLPAVGRSGKGLLHHKQAILSGLFGVDCEHGGCKSELHPVFALAAHVVNDPADDVWAMFVRNAGNEGFCSSQIWQDGFTTYTFRLPWRDGMTAAEVLWGIGQSVFDGTPGTSGPTVAVAPGRGIEVTFHLPPPPERPLIDGELHLRWRGPAGAIARAPRAPGAGKTDETSDETEREAQHEIDDEAGPLRAAFDRLGAARKAQIARPPVTAPSPIAAPQRLPRGSVSRAVPRLAPSGPATQAIRPVGPATRKLARDAARVRALCSAGDGAADLPREICAAAAP